MSDVLNDANEFGGTDTCSVFDIAPNLTGGGTPTLYLGGPEFKSRPADQIF
jgi:hypothetical protein